MRSIFFAAALLAAVGLLTDGCGPTVRVPPVTINITVPGGGGFTDPGGGDFRVGTTRAFQARAFSGFEFVQWEGDITSTDNPLSIAMTTDLNLTAVFRSLTANVPPEATNLNIATTEDISVNFDLIATDADADTITFSFPTLPTNGTLTNVSGNTYTYEPGPGYVGADRFTYRGNDGTDDSNTATVNVIVQKAMAIGWARSFGGSAADAANAVAVDDTGAVYVAGSFSDSVDFDPGIDSEIRTANGTSTDIFLARYSNDGELDWIVTFGGSGDDKALAVDVGPFGNVYVAGYFSARVDFDTGAGSEFLESAGSKDAFLSKYSAAGIWQWTDVFGGSNDVIANATAVSPAGNIYVAGSFAGVADMNPGSASDNLTSAGGLDGFVVKVSPTDGDQLWSAAFGGTDDDEILAACVDDTHRVTVAGYFSTDIDVDPGPGTTTVTNRGGEDAIAIRLSSVGTFGFAYTAGGTLSDRANAVRKDSSGRLFVGGFFGGTADLDGTDYVTNGGTDAFVVLLGGTGTVQWTRTFGGVGDDQVSAVVFDPPSNVYLAGFFTHSVDFDPGVGTDVQTSDSNSADIFVSKFSSASGTYAWVDTFGGSGDDRALALASTAFHHIFCAGTFEGTVDLNPDPLGWPDAVSLGAIDAFLFKITGSTGQWE